MPPAACHLAHSRADLLENDELSGKLGEIRSGHSEGVFNAPHLRRFNHPRPFGVDVLRQYRGWHG